VHFFNHSQKKFQVPRNLNAVLQLLQNCNEIPSLKLRLLLTEMCNAMHSLTWQKTNFFRFPAQTLISCAINFASLVSDVKQNQNSSSWAMRFVNREQRLSLSPTCMYECVCFTSSLRMHVLFVPRTHKFIYSAGCARD
jgi:hypothetical protein